MSVEEIFDLLVTNNQQLESQINSDSVKNYSSLYEKYTDVESLINLIISKISSLKQNNSTNPKFLTLVISFNNVIDLAKQRLSEDLNEFLEVEPTSPASESQTPISEPQTPISEPQSPVSDLQSLVDEPQSPVNEPMTPLSIQSEISISEPQSPVIEPQTPISEPEISMSVQIRKFRYRI